MSGNKPFENSPSEFAARSPFTARIATHPKVSYFPYPGEALLVTMVIDQILVGTAAAENDEVRAALAAQGAIDTGVKVFDENPVPNENVSIWKLDSTPGDQDYADVAEKVWKVRQVLEVHDISPGQVAPNHVLIPAANYHSCPWGPPDHSDEDPRELGAANGSVTVTVIDSGYQVRSPITPRLNNVAYGLWFAEDPAAPGSFAWIEENEGVDPLNQDDDHHLDALVGHANFVAGVIAQVCRVATINVISHNGAFVDNDSSDWPIPTEASVARSLWDSRNSDVINVGFAFPTLPTIPPDRGITDGPPSWALELVIRSIAHRTAPIIVAPAGNQRSKRPQYPAAFHNVVGVGSVGPEGQRSSFSNHGPWVACCTNGEHVVSTFITDTRPWLTEDKPPGYAAAATWPTKDFSSGWASWSGTSFAAPKVAGGIANGKAAGATPLSAWNDMQAAGQPSGRDMGVLLDDPRA